MAKMGINQVEFGTLYNSEKYYNPVPGAKKGPVRYFFTGDDCSVALGMLDARLPQFKEHAHPHEQFTVVLQGDGKAVIDGKEYDAGTGFFMYCPPNISHAYNTTEATYTCWNLDVFYPERLEYDKDNFFRLLAQGKDPMKTMITKDTQN